MRIEFYPEQRGRSHQSVQEASKCLFWTRSGFLSEPRVGRHWGHLVEIPAGPTCTTVDSFFEIYFSVESSRNCSIGLWLTASRHIHPKTQADFWVKRRPISKKSMGWWGHFGQNWQQMPSKDKRVRRKVIRSNLLAIKLNILRFTLFIFFQI